MVFDPTTPRRDINRRLLLSFHEDGFLDIIAGLIIVTFGLIPLLDGAGMNAGLRQVLILAIYFFCIAVIIGLRRWITIPRAGYVKLTRKKSTRLSLVLMMVNVLIFIILGVAYLFDFSLTGNLEKFRLSIPLGMIYLILLSTSGALLKAPRFHLYGILVLGSFLFFEFLSTRGVTGNFGIPAASFSSGGLLILNGSFHLIRFLRKYNKDEPRN